MEPIDILQSDAKFLYINNRYDIEKLHLNNMSIEILEINNCIYLTELILPQTIKYLRIDHCNHLKITNINELKNICFLSLHHCNITDIVLNESIKVLNICSKINKLDVTNCINLISLELHGCTKLEQISGISINILKIDLSMCIKLNNINELIKPLNKLIELNVSYTNINCTEGLEHVAKIIMTNCSNITNIDNLINSTELILSRCYNLKNIDKIINTLQLQTLKIKHNSDDIFVVVKNIKNINFSNQGECYIGNTDTKYKIKILNIFECYGLKQSKKLSEFEKCELNSLKNALNIIF